MSDPVLMRRKQVAEQLGVSVRTVQRMSGPHGLKVHRLHANGHPYYCRIEVEEFVGRLVGTRGPLNPNRSKVCVISR